MIQDQRMISIHKDTNMSRTRKNDTRSSYDNDIDWQKIMWILKNAIKWYEGLERMIIYDHHMEIKWNDIQSYVGWKRMIYDQLILVLKNEIPSEDGRVRMIHTQHNMLVKNDIRSKDGW